MHFLVNRFESALSLQALSSIIPFLKLYYFVTSTFFACRRWLYLLPTAFILHIDGFFRNIINIADENGTNDVKLP